LTALSSLPLFRFRRVLKGSFSILTTFSPHSIFLFRSGSGPLNPPFFCDSSFFPTIPRGIQRFLHFARPNLTFYFLTLDVSRSFCLKTLPFVGHDLEGGVRCFFPRSVRFAYTGASPATTNYLALFFRDFKTGHIDHPESTESCVIRDALLRSRFPVNTERTQPLAGLLF